MNTQECKQSITLMTSSDFQKLLCEIQLQNPLPYILHHWTVQCQRYSLEIVLDATALAFKDDFGYGNLWFLKF